MRFALVLLASTAFPPALQENVETHHAAVVRVDANDGKGNVCSGSGVLIACEGENGIVLTAWHNVQDGGPYNVQFPGDQENQTPEILAYSDEFDVAALKVQVPPGVKPIPLATSRPLTGDQVELCGYGGGRWGRLWTKIRGYFQHRSEVITDLGLQHITINGESGAPVVSLENGRPRVAGIVWGGPTDMRWSNTQMKHGQASDCLQLRAWLAKEVAPDYSWVVDKETVQTE